MDLIRLGPELEGRVVGEGPSILWVHGYTLDSRSWADLWSLLPGYRHIGVDLPGHGRSGAIEPGMTLSELGRRLASLSEAHAIEAVVGLSFGGTVALQLLFERPLRAAVLAAAGLAGGPTEPSMVPVYQRMSLLRVMAGRSSALTDLWLGSRAFRGLDARPGLRSSLRAIVDEHRFEELADRRKLSMLTEPAQALERVEGVRTPVLVMIGADEMDAYRGAADLLVAHLPNHRRVELPSTDHLCLLQSPERAAPHLVAHFRRCGLEPVEILRRA